MLAHGEDNIVPAQPFVKPKMKISCNKVTGCGSMAFMENKANEIRELKLRSVRITLGPHEYECLKLEADKNCRAVSRQVVHILKKRYNKRKAL